MGAGACVVIIEGNNVQAESEGLAQQAITSCQLVEYLREEKDFDPADLNPIIAFHLKAKTKLAKLSDELAEINKEFAAKYNDDIS